MSDAPVTVVTGANSGIGRATALHLAESGHTVYATVRSVSRAEKLLAGAEALGVGVELVELDIASLGQTETIPDYIAAFNEAFGVDIST
jgi:NAD(P)-dependent dehydrogenase (short-subunit alcohol dehydrogenase family)